MSASRAGIRSTPVEDLYIIASEFGEDGRAIFRIYVNPLVGWMWLSGLVMLLGTVVALWPERSRASRRVERPRSEERGVATRA
jgi:cytochrome c-type biogenesis protein CcmF